MSDQGDGKAGAGKRAYIGLTAAFVVFAAVAVQVALQNGGSSVFAATFSPPSAQPPEGNIPVTVWNRIDSTEKQAAASIEIDGGGPAEDPDPTKTRPVGISVGDENLNMGPTDTVNGQNLYYGLAPYATMSTADRLILLQTYATGAWTDRFSVDRDGNLWSSGCFGPILRGITSTKYTGNLNGTPGGYFGANGLCSSFGASAHICSVAEVLNSIKCAGATSKMKDTGLSGVDAWIQDGPPGYTSPANDCQGWRSNNTGHLGRIWRFDSGTGGQGFLTTCNQTIVFACCR